MFTTGDWAETPLSVPAVTVALEHALAREYIDASKTLDPNQALKLSGRVIRHLSDCTYYEEILVDTYKYRHALSFAFDDRAKLNVSMFTPSSIAERQSFDLPSHRKNMVRHLIDIFARQYHMALLLKYGGTGNGEP